MRQPVDAMEVHFSDHELRDLKKRQPIIIPVYVFLIILFLPIGLPVWAYYKIKGKRAPQVYV